jgi:hypothetical protein
LKIEDVLEVDFPLPSFQRAKRRWKNELRGINDSNEEPDEWVLGDESNLATADFGATLKTFSSISENLLEDNGVCLILA